MTALLIIVSYVAVWLVYGWRLSIYLIDKEIREWRKASDGRMVAGRFESKYVDRSDSIMVGFFVSGIWPVAMPVRGAYRLMSGRGLFITPVEREIEQEQRLKELERIVREYKLPMPAAPPLGRPHRCVACGQWFATEHALRAHPHAPVDHRG